MESSALKKAYKPRLVAKPTPKVIIARLPVCDVRPRFPERYPITEARDSDCLDMLANIVKLTLISPFGFAIFAGYEVREQFRHLDYHMRGIKHERRFDSWVPYYEEI